MELNAAVNLMELFTEDIQQALLAAARTTNSELSAHRDSRETWRIMPPEEKNYMKRSVLYQNILENLYALNPDGVKAVPIRPSKGSKIGNVNIIVIENLGIHLISNRREDCPTLRRFRHKQKYGKEIFGDIDFEDIDLPKLQGVQIFDCVYIKRGINITELIIHDQYDSEVKEIRLEVVEGQFAPSVEHQPTAKPKVAFKPREQENQ